MKISDSQLKEILLKAVEDFSREREAPGCIRWFADRAPDILFSVGIELVLSGAESPGVRYLCLRMLKDPNFFREVTDPWKYTVSESVNLARRLLAVERSLDIQLARCLPRRNAHESEETLLGEHAQRALQILDEISVGRRIVSVLNHLSRHSDPRISSKSMLLVGKRVQSLTWAKRMLVESKDPRIRANAVEAFWGVSSKGAMQLFHTSLSDENNRVVGNSIMGLHLAGEPDVNRLIVQSAHHFQAPFRWTASWMMGKIGDPAYVAPLTDLTRDSDATVRSAALRSLLDIRQEEKWRVIQESDVPGAPLPMQEEATPHNDKVSLPPEIDVSLLLEGNRLERDSRKSDGRAKWLF